MAAINGVSVPEDEFDRYFFELATHCGRLAGALTCLLEVDERLERGDRSGSESADVVRVLSRAALDQFDEWRAAQPHPKVEVL